MSPNRRSRRPAQFDMPPREQMEFLQQLALEADAAPASDDEAWWQSVLSDPRAAGSPPLPIEQRRLSEVPRDMLRVECLRCFRTVEISRSDALKLYGPHAVLKDLAMPLLEPGCKERIGSRDDGCWPSWVR